MNPAVTIQEIHVADVVKRKHTCVVSITPKTLHRVVQVAQPNVPKWHYIGHRELAISKERIQTRRALISNLTTDASAVIPATKVRIGHVFRILVLCLNG